MRYDTSLLVEATLLVLGSVVNIDCGELERVLLQSAVWQQISGPLTVLCTEARAKKEGRAGQCGKVMCPRPNPDLCDALATLATTATSHGKSNSTP